MYKKKNIQIKQNNRQPSPPVPSFQSSTFPRSYSFLFVFAVAKDALPSNQFTNRGIDNYLQCAGTIKPQESCVMIHVSNFFCNYTSTTGAELLRALDSSIFAATSATMSLVRSSPAIKAAAMSIVKTALQLFVEM